MQYERKCINFARYTRITYEESKEETYGILVHHVTSLPDNQTHFKVLFGRRRYVDFWMLNNYWKV
jgi:hypothetical protein